MRDRYLPALVTLLLFSVGAQAQVLQRQNGYGMQFKRLQADTSLGIPADTLTLTATQRMAPHLAVKDGVLYQWRTDSLKWSAVGINSNTPADPCSYASSGGIAVWQSGLTFNVTPSEYYHLNCRQYSSAGGTVTLSSAHATLHRIDAIVLDTLGQVVVIAGTAAESPAQPFVDPTLYHLRTFVLVTANATTPADVSTFSVYDENTEWTTATFGTITANFNSTAFAVNGTKSIAVTSRNNGSAVQFTGGSAVQVSSYQTVSFWLRLAASLTNQQNISVQFFSGTTAVSNAVTASVNKGAANAWQLVALPFSQFTFTGVNFDRVRIAFAGTSSNALYIDMVRLQSGLQSGGSSGGGGLQNAYTTVTDGTTSIAATGSDVLKIRSVDGKATVTVSNNGTHGKNVAIKVNDDSLYVPLNNVTGLQTALQGLLEDAYWRTGARDSMFIKRNGSEVLVYVGPIVKYNAAQFSVTPTAEGDSVSLVGGGGGSTDTTSLSNRINNRWALTGNAGTDSTATFIGTTDNKPLIFRVNGQRAGLVSRYGTNTSLGYQSLKDASPFYSGSDNKDQFNTAIGYEALMNNHAVPGNLVNFEGSFNTAIGAGALRATTNGSGNMAMGNSTLLNNISGGNNVAIGHEALFTTTNTFGSIAVGYRSQYSFTSGGANTALGYHSLLSNTTGQANTAIGYMAMEGNNGGNNNVAVGESAMRTGSGYQNTAVGFYALYNGSSGENTAIGYNAGASNPGTMNTFLGNRSGIGANSGNNNTLVGYHAGGYQGSASNCIKLGWYAGNTSTASNKLFIAYGTDLQTIHGDLSTGQVQINAPATPTLEASSQFDVFSTTRGARPFPVMTQAQRTAIASPAVGIHVYQTDGTEGVYVYKSTGWAFAY